MLVSYTKRKYLFARESVLLFYARIIKSGSSQAVRLPKEFRFNVDRVEIFRRGDEIILRECPLSATAIFDALTSMPADFMDGGRTR